MALLCIESSTPRVQFPDINNAPKRRKSTWTSIGVVALAGDRRSGTSSVSSSRSQQRRGDSMSGFEVNVSLVFALASQTSAISQRVLMDLVNETAKYVFPQRRFESRNLEEALMSVPELETMNFKVLSRNDMYEIREVEPYMIAETTMPSKDGFDFYGASQSFNVLAEYLFGKNTKKEKMDMTTPVLTSRTQANGEKMEMTTPVITKRVENQDTWRMSFVMPSKYGSDLPLPKDSSVVIREVPKKVVAVIAFSGFVTDEEVKLRESKLRDALKYDSQFRVKESSSVEVAQYNPPFTLPFNRRNEIALEVAPK